LSLGTKKSTYERKFIGSKSQQKFYEPFSFELKNLFKNKNEKKALKKPLFV